MGNPARSARRLQPPRLDEAALARFLDEDDGRPVVILSLLRFPAETGIGRCAEYLSAIRPELARYGAELVYVGDGRAALWDDETGAWDAVSIVRYPSRRTFATMLETTEYFEMPTALHEAATVEIVLRALPEFH